MSYRGSFATEYIYCKDCFNIVKEVLSSYYWDIMVYKEHIISGAIRDFDEETMVIDFENLLEEISCEIKDDCTIRFILFGETFTSYYGVNRGGVDLIYKEKLEWENKRK